MRRPDVPNAPGSDMTVARASGAGAVAGMVSTVVFTVIHDLFISDIWFALFPMLVAGALCGALLAWSYVLMVPQSSFVSWLVYNGWYLLMFGVLGVASVLVFDPVTTLAAVIAANAPPNDLIRQAAPMTAGFLAGMIAILGRRYSTSLRHYLAVGTTCAVLMLLLGLNISAIGLVDIPMSGAYLIAELLALNVALAAVYAGTYMLFDADVRPNPLPKVQT